MAGPRLTDYIGQPRATAPGRIARSERSQQPPRSDPGERSVQEAARRSKPGTSTPTGGGRGSKTGAGNCAE